MRKELLLPSFVCLCVVVSAPSPIDQLYCTPSSFTASQDTTHLASATSLLVLHQFSLPTEHHPYRQASVNRLRKSSIDSDKIPTKVNMKNVVAMQRLCWRCGFVVVLFQAVRCSALSSSSMANNPAATAGQQPQGQQDGEYSSSVYYDQSKARDSIDQGCYESSKFWNQVDECLPNWRTNKDLVRFQGFCTNLKTEQPGREVYLDNGQQLLAQYIFPGIDDDGTESGVHRSAYPTPHYEELQQLEQRLKSKVAPVGQKELSTLLQARPLVSDTDEFSGIEENDGDTWQRAAWFGWQYLSLRGAQRFMPKTSKALKQAMDVSKSGPAHRFVGITRQKAGVKGVVHSDGRNYMLSTLTPLSCPKNCGIVVNDIDATIEQGGKPIILDNTFPHYVYNDGEFDRYVLMSEIWHPSLSFEERNALAVLFAAKDRFTVTELKLAPWGYDDDSLEFALTTGAVNDIEFWKEIGYDRTAARVASVFEKTSSSSSSAKKNRKNKKASGAAGGKKGFGK